MNNGGSVMQVYQRRIRFRRAAKQIERHYECPVRQCAKSYG
jgi:hypothetical protein